MEQYGNQTTKKPAKQKKCETCALYISIPAKQLIPVRTFKFGRSQPKF